MTQRRDTLFDTPIAQVPDFTFNEDVARVFPDMIKRSVPGYPTIVENSGVLAAQFARPHSLIYDLGCSLGAVTQAMRRHVTQPGCRILAVDNSPAMVGRCREYLKAQDAMHQELLPAEVAEADILQLELEPCSVVALNFTLQFIPPGRRLELLGNIQRQLLPGGALLLSSCVLMTRKNTSCLTTCIWPSSGPMVTANWRSPKSVVPSKKSCYRTPWVSTASVYKKQASTGSTSGFNVSTLSR